jgi:hypothetical protein
MSDISKDLKLSLVDSLNRLAGSVSAVRDVVQGSTELNQTKVEIGDRQFEADVVEAADGTLTLIIKGVPKPL